MEIPNEIIDFMVTSGNDEVIRFFLENKISLKKIQDAKLSKYPDWVVLEYCKHNSASVGGIIYYLLTDGKIDLINRILDTTKMWKESDLSSSINVITGSGNDFSKNKKWDNRKVSFAVTEKLIANLMGAKHDDTVESNSLRWMYHESMGTHGDISNGPSLRYLKSVVVVANSDAKRISKCVEKHDGGWYLTNPNPYEAENPFVTIWGLVDDNTMSADDIIHNASSYLSLHLVHST